MNALGVKLGYGFSAGLFDYVLNYGKATRPLMLLPVGAVYAVIYYGLFRWAIVRFNLPTPGREAPEAVPAGPAVAADAKAAAFVAALGGAANLRGIDACATRLRLAVADAQAIDEPRLRQLGARGVLRPSPTAVQVIVGGIADGLAMEMRAALDAAPPAAAVVAPPPVAAAPVALSDALLAALGGRGNVGAVSRHGSRLRVVVGDRAQVDEAALGGDVRAVVWPKPDVVHLLMPA
jgi:PTS system N-acetylglucosamine-specific IIC component